MTTQELREAAARRIETRGWWSEGKECSVGDGDCIQLALYRASHDLGVPHELELESAALREMGFEATNDYSLFKSAHRWNDAPERTKEEVLARLRGMPLPEPPQ